MKEKNSDLIVKRSLKTICWLIVAIIIILVLYKIPAKYRIIFCALITIALVSLSIAILASSFYDWEKFNRDTVYLFTSFGALEFFLFILSYIFVDNYIDLIGYAYVIPIMFLINGVFFWWTYYLGCLKTIKELNKDKYIFFASSAKLILGAILVWWASKEIIGSFDYNTNYYYQFFNILVNSSYPLIGMYIYVRTEINKLDNPKKTRSELRKKQFNDVEQSINSFANSDDLDDLKESINKKRKKLEKGKFAGVKKIIKICVKKIVEICDDNEYVKKFVEICDYKEYVKKIVEIWDKKYVKKYVKKFATLEDLDNLKKIIDKKNNNTEKNMD